MASEWNDEKAFSSLLGLNSFEKLENFEQNNRGGKKLTDDDTNVIWNSLEYSKVFIKVKELKRLWKKKKKKN